MTYMCTIRERHMGYSVAGDNYNRTTWAYDFDRNTRTVFMFKTPVIFKHIECIGLLIYKTTNHRAEITFLFDSTENPLLYNMTITNTRNIICNTAF